MRSVVGESWISQPLSKQHRPDERCLLYKFRSKVLISAHLNQVNADAVVAIEAEVSLSEDMGATAVWALTDGVLDGYDDLSLAVSSSLEYEVL